MVSCRWTLVWQDEFTGHHLNEHLWKHDLNKSFNSELQSYTAGRNVRVSDGLLTIEARPEKDDGYDFTSGRLITKQAWVGGKFEIRARLPRGRQLWPAIWMLPATNAYGLWWKNGEIDLMEAQGERPSVISGTAHYGGTSSTSGNRRYPFDFSRHFHTFGLIWDRRQMRWFVDGTLFHSVRINRNLWPPTAKGVNPYRRKGQPFDQPFRILLNVAVGGTFFGEGVPKVTPEEARSGWPKPTMEVDFVRVYQWRRE
ncbi:hypothetical protein TYRP_011363 [Tyrophagus putrescentiae]|nr:hypothetical protein TYRP_011363 [Tyrophagus putrescentiae]